MIIVVRSCPNAFMKCVRKVSTILNEKGKTERIGTNHKQPTVPYMHNQAPASLYSMQTQIVTPSLKQTTLI